jgi:putative oxidoreductase
MLAKDVRMPLLFLRLSVALVMAVWVADKFYRPEHAAAVFADLYSITGLQTWVIYALGALQGIVVLAFVVGWRKRLSYGLVLLMHMVPTLANFKLYLSPLEGDNILLFAAWPMLAAVAALYNLRDQDTLLTMR